VGILLITMLTNIKVLIYVEYVVLFHLQEWTTPKLENVISCLVGEGTSCTSDISPWSFFPQGPVERQRIHLDVWRASQGNNTTSQAHHFCVTKWHLLETP
jgi:hypothetical protein